MSDTFNTVSSISIARHAVQFMLRAAMEADPASCFGLIGRNTKGEKGCTITHSSPFGLFRTPEDAAGLLANSDLQHMLKNWSTEGIAPCGIYFSTQNGIMPELSELQSLQNSVTTLVPIDADSCFILLPLLLNTAGCLEAFAYQIHDESLLSIPLQLAEDGQQAKNG